MENGHVVRIAPEIAAHYPMEEKADMSYAPRKIAFREEKERLEPISVPKAFIDTNQHMNNAQYIRTALEFVPEDFHIRQVRVEYSMTGCILLYIRMIKSSRFCLEMQKVRPTRLLSSKDR